jgi:hypothetical protein
MDKAERFKAANKESRVVSATVVGLGGEGATYRLADGRTFKLTAAECEAVGKVRWRSGR